MTTSTSTRGNVDTAVETNKPPERANVPTAVTKRTVEAVRMADPHLNTSGADRLGDWMLTATGIQFWPLDPRPEEIRIEDIAHSLANQCRFAGHCRWFYSVAQHSVLVSHVVPAEHALWGLLHDAAEAYLVDLPRPIKRYSEIGEAYQLVERQLMATICVRFGLPIGEPDSVKLADDVLLMTEKRDLMPQSPAWHETAEPLAERIRVMQPKQAEWAFLSRYVELWALACRQAEAPSCS